MHNGLVHRYIYMYELSMSVWLLLRALECNGESKLLFDETMPVFCASQQPAGRNISFLFIMITKPSRLFSNSLILRATGKNTMYLLYALWFGPTRNWSHDFRTRGNYVNHYTTEVINEFWDIYKNTCSEKQLSGKYLLFFHVQN